MTAPAPHPVAAIFPMLSATELWKLADDIAAQGLLHPAAAVPAPATTDRDRARRS
jgi:hypothetical protein